MLRKKMKKKSVIWRIPRTQNTGSERILSAPKYVIMNLKINNFKDDKSTITKNIRHIFLEFISISMCMFVRK